MTTKLHNLHGLAAGFGLGLVLLTALAATTVQTITLSNIKDLPSATPLSTDQILGVTNGTTARLFTVSAVVAMATNDAKTYTDSILPGVNTNTVVVMATNQAKTYADATFASKASQTYQATNGNLSAVAAITGLWTGVRTNLIAGVLTQRLTYASGVLSNVETISY